MGANEDKTRIRKPSDSTDKLPARFQASVVIVKGYAEGMEYPLTKTYTVLGRDKEADIAVKDSLVSRRHVAILYHDGGFVLKDLESTNGTMMKGALIQQADIRHKDKFRIGDTTLQFILEDFGGGRVYEIKEEIEE
jgi:pSer/pThr/pTyr-binding forkhead associated (FHA) protein